MSNTSLFPCAVRQRFWLCLSGVILLVIGLLLGAVAGYRYALEVSRSQGWVTLTRAQAQAQQQVLQQYDAQARLLRAQLDTVNGEIVIERAARQELETQLRQTQLEMGRVRDQLAFYEQLLPPGPAGSLDIRGADFSRDGNGLRYKILIMRSSRGDASFNGELRFKADGNRLGEKVNIDLQPLQIKTEENAVATPDAVAALATGDSISSAAGSAPNVSPPPVLALHFDQFQRSQGILSVPEGFVPETITVQILEDGVVRASRRVKLEF